LHVSRVGDPLTSVLKGSNRLLAILIWNESNGPTLSGNSPFVTTAMPRLGILAYGKVRPLSDLQHLKKTAPEGAVSGISTCNRYAAFLRRAIPISPSKPEPKSQAAAGIGTAATLKSNEKSDAPPTASSPKAFAPMLALAERV